MKEKEFKKIIEKYLKGTLSEEERAIFEKFNDKLTSKAKDAGFKDDAQKNNIREAVWSKLADFSNKKTKTASWKLVASAAAIFFGIMFTGYLYLQNTTVSIKTIIPENAIVLELEDGSIKVIQENGVTELTDKKGNILGKQKGSSLVYNNENDVKTLTYNTLKVPYGKTFELKLSDGTTAHLNAGSSIKYPVKFLKGKQREIFITGEAYLDVAKDEAHPFIVSSGNLNVRVLGTQFNFSAYPEDATTEVVLVEGSVSMFTEDNGYNETKNTLLTPGFKGSFNRKNSKLATKQVNVSSYTSWMKGKLIFRNMTFNNILKKLERHYNVSIVNNNTALNTKIFNANFGNQTLQEVLKELNMNYGISYTVSNDKISID